MHNHMFRYWKSVRAVLCVIVCSPSLSVLAGEQYACECCGKYISKTIMSHQAGKLGDVSYEQLLKAERYEDILQKFETSYRFGNYSRDDVGWWSEALYALGELKTGRPDPNRGPVFFVGEEPKDPIAHDLRRLHDRFRKRNWDKASIKQYGYPAVCGLSEYRIKNPRFWGYHARYITLLIATGRYDDVLREAKSVKKNSLVIDEPPGEFLAMFLEQYVGAALYEQGAHYLVMLKRSHGLKSETENYWTKMLLRGVDSEEIEKGKKDALKARVVHALKG